MNIIQAIPLLWHRRRPLLNREKSLVLPFGKNRLAVRLLSYDLYVVAEVFGEQVYAPRMVQIQSPAVVVDLGANIGAFSLWAARRWKPQLIVSVEMDEQNYALFEENMLLNRLESQVRLVKAAIWDHNEQVGIRRYGFNHGMNQACSELTGGARIPAITLDRLLDMTGVEKVDVMKVDIEGAEGRLFSEKNERILAGSVGCLLAELHPTRGISVDRMAGLLERIGFEVHIRPQPLRTTLILEAVNRRR